MQSNMQIYISNTQFYMEMNINMHNMPYTLPLMGPAERDRTRRSHGPHGGPARRSRSRSPLHSHGRIAVACDWPAARQRCRDFEFSSLIACDYAQLWASYFRAQPNARFKSGQGLQVASPSPFALSTVSYGEVLISACLADSAIRNSSQDVCY
jgi:hypothetical protein